MRKESTTTIRVNDTRIVFSKKKLTAYGGFSLLAAFFERIRFREMVETVIPVTESSPNAMGVYGKIVAYISMIYAGAERFSHLVYLGNREVIAKVFGVHRLPAAPTTLTRFFAKLKNCKGAEALSDGIWRYLSQVIPWEAIREDWVTFDSTVLIRTVWCPGRIEKRVQSGETRQTEPPPSHRLSQQEQVRSASLEPIGQRDLVEQQRRVLRHRL